VQLKRSLLTTKKLKGRAKKRQTNKIKAKARLTSKQEQPYSTRLGLFVQRVVNKGLPVKVTNLKKKKKVHKQTQLKMLQNPIQKLNSRQI
jgi:hypothetical protein